jgi:hypothetical protein
MNPRRLLCLLGALTVLGCAAPAGAAAADPCAAPVNPVACENTKPGTPESVWGIDGSGDDTIQGYATSISVNKGDPISFKIKAGAQYTMNIYRLGYYNGDGARLMAGNVTHSAPQTQPACQVTNGTGLIDCGNWSTSATWTVPSTAVSGLYIAYLKRNDTGGDSQITFVVRDDSSHSDVLLQTSDETWQAYNRYGGNSLYNCTVGCPADSADGYQAAFAVSYNRPFDTGGSSERSWWHSAEYPMIRFLEANGYDLSYTSGIDTATRPSLLTNHKLFMSSGHDEYWSGPQRNNIEAARDAGLNLAFFSGNEVFWKTRLAASSFGSGANRTLISYKDTHFQGREDPVEWTGTWRDPRFAAPPEGGRSENSLTGTSFVVNSGSTAITVPWTYKNMRMWRNTAVASLPTGSSATLAPQTLGYEWDEDPDNGFRSPGQFRLSSTTVSGVETFTDFGTWTNPSGTATHNLTLHRMPSGALVFGAGTVQWSWGLDSANPNGNTPNTTMRQATLNLLADMNVQPFAPISGLLRATKSTDATAPTATITSPSAGANLTDGTAVTISGTAADTGGGQVAGVEVSTDGGSTWHPATGTTSWTYSWKVHGAPTANIRVRAVDDTGNLGTAGAGTTVNVGCPCSIWGDQYTPAQADSGDTGSIEVGVKFKSDIYGAVTGVRFYKAAANTGTHIGSLWAADGTRLAQATFTSETSSGWQKVTFPSPVQVTPGTTYIASYHAPNGHYSATKDYMWPGSSPGPHGLSTLDAAPLHAIRNFGTVTNGLYAYGATTTLPTNSYSATSYWVDVMFSPTPAPGAVSNVTATAAGKTSASVSWTAPTTGGAPASYKITPYIGATAQTPTTINGSPPATTAVISGLTNGTTYRFTVQAINPAGSGPVSAQSNAVTPLNAVAPTAPRNVLARPLGSAAQVEWAAPTNDGDSPITGYTVTPYIGAVAQDPAQAAAGATSLKVTGLTNGTDYTFKVSASNAIGSSPASSPSTVATPGNTIYELAAPSTVDSQDTGSVELGVKFRADSNGSITGIRFYKADANTGTHTGSLWSVTGTRLAQVTFSNESSNGWQAATFSTPVSVTAGTTYVASYFAPSGHYSVTSGGLTLGVDNPPLHALASSSGNNGVYLYSAGGGFPTNSYNSGDYGVDVLYTVPKPGAVSNVAASTAGPSSANVTWTEPTTGGTPSSYKITPYDGTTALTPTIATAPATKKKVGGLTTGHSYRFTVQAVNGSGGGPVSAQSNAVTPSDPIAPGAPTAVVARPITRAAQVSWTAPEDDGESPITGYTVTPYIGSTPQDPVTVSGTTTTKTVTGLTNGFTYTFRVKATNAVGSSPDSADSPRVSPGYTLFELATPDTDDSTDPSPVELGVKFRADRSGTVTGVRFYKGAGNTGTHTGSLWTAGGTRLAQATFSNETAGGWQAATFATPVQVTGGTTYVVSYYAPNGHYSVTSQGLDSAFDNAPLHALAGASNDNGVFIYGGGNQFPDRSYHSGNYWVDLTFAGDPPPGTPTGVTATATQAGAAVSWTAPSSGGPIESYEVTPYIGSTAQTSKTITGTPPSTSTNVTGLTPGTSYTFKVRAGNIEGQGLSSAASNAVTPTISGLPGQPTGVTAAPDALAALVRWTPPSDGGNPLTSYTVTPYIGGTAQTPVTIDAPASRGFVTGLDPATSYTFRVRANNTNGGGPTSSETGAVTPLRSLFGFATPATTDGGDGNAVELGVRFQSSSAGTINGIRFYKADTNTGTHTGSLWSATGTLLAQGTFSGESASGWQTLTFATPVAIDADTTYVAGYHAPNGHYSVTGAVFDGAPFSNPPLTALADGSAGNGLYQYSSSPILPTNSYNAANYFVDVLYGPGS